MVKKFNNHKDWIRGWPYSGDAPDDKKWQKDMAQTCDLNGNGWWWGWTHLKCPIEGLKPHLKELRELRDKLRKAEASGE